MNMKTISINNLAELYIVPVKMQNLRKKKPIAMNSNGGERRS